MRYTGGTAAPRWRLSAGALVVALLVVAGATFGLYPSAASWFHAGDQRAAIDGSSAVQIPGPSNSSTALAAAHAYNARLSAGAEVSGRIPAGTSTSDYNAQLADGTGIMSRLRIPSIGVDLPVYHGTSDATLARGLGHLEGTALPVGGAGTRSVITGHRGLAEATMFTHLDRLRTGDELTLTTFGQVLVYRVTSTAEVDPADVESVDPVPGKDLVTLVTCTPIGINTKRLLVTAERVSPVPAAAVTAAARPPSAGFPWWAVAAGAALIVAGLYVWWAGRPHPGPDGSRT